MPPSKAFGVTHLLTLDLDVFDFAENLFGKYLSVLGLERQQKENWIKSQTLIAPFPHLWTWAHYATSLSFDFSPGTMRLMLLQREVRSNAII